MRSYHPIWDVYSSHSISFSGVYARENKGSSKLILVPQIILSDIPNTMPERARYVDSLNATLYLNIWLKENSDTMDELRRELPLLGQTIQASLDSFMSRRLPKADEHSAKRLMETLFFHEIGEILYQTLPVNFKNEWRELLNTPGSRPLPGIITFKDNFKALTQASTGMGPIDAAPEFFADCFAMFFYPDNVYSAYGEPFRDGWKKFMEKTRAYLLQKQRQGRNILEIDDSNLVDTVIQNETFIMQDDLQALFDKLASSAGDNAQLSQDRAMTNTGGIDFKSDKVDSAFAVKSNGGEIKFHIDPAMLQQLQNAPGFVPVIINIQPMNDLRLFLGITDGDPSLRSG